MQKTVERPQYIDGVRRHCSQIETALQMVEHRATVAEVKLVNLIDRDLPKLFCDKKRMTQVLINLLTNAVKFTPKGGTISIDAPINVEGNFALSITDTGIGMDEGEIKMAFERFCQIDRVSFDAQEGVGLGLPFVKELVEAHGGSLNIVSQPGAGTTVTVELPKERLKH